MSTIVSLIRDRVLDAELAALLWLLVDAGVPVHVAAPAEPDRATAANAFRSIAHRPEEITEGPGAALEDVLRMPVPMRPATGAVLVLDESGRLRAAHFHRPPLRDAGGHVRPQAPAVLATWDAGLDGWEHFAWGVIPDLADAAARKAGDFEIELGRRREYLQALTSSTVDAPGEVAAAIRGYRVSSPAQ